MRGQVLYFQQLNGKMQAFSSLNKIIVPPTGWIKAIREALGISAEQLGNKLSITRQGVYDMENREKDGVITLRSLKETAGALNMHLVYGFVPNAGSLDALVEARAKELAKQIVMRTSNTMKLEDQENSGARIEKAIEELATELKKEMPKALWD